MGVAQPGDPSSLQSSQPVLQVSVPSWTYAFKPFSEKGRYVAIGQLFVKVIGATNLPGMVRERVLVVLMGCC